jgi:hypothetical protein
VYPMQFGMRSVGARPDTLETLVTFVDSVGKLGGG